MATVTAAQAKFDTTAVGWKKTEIDSSVTISNGEVLGFNTDAEVVEFNATAAMIYYGMAQGQEKAGDGTADYEADVFTGEAQIDHTKWTLSGTSATNYMVPMYHTGSTTAPTFTRPSTYGQVAGYQDNQLEFVQFSEAQRALLGIAGGDKRTHSLGIIEGADITTDGRYFVYNYGRKSIPKIGVRVTEQLAPTNTNITLTVYKGTAVGTAYSVGTIGLTGTANLAPGAEVAYTTAFTANDGEKLWVVASSIGTAATAGSFQIFYEEVGRGGN